MNKTRIFVTVGNCIHGFDRLFLILNNKIQHSNKISYEIRVQFGESSIPLFSQNANLVSCDSYITTSQYNENLDWADVVISHCGVGTILGALERGKKCVVLARLGALREHIDDHQVHLKIKLLELNLVSHLDDISTDVWCKRLEGRYVFLPPKFDFPTDSVICISSVGGHRVAMEKCIKVCNAEKFIRVTDEECSETRSGEYLRFPSCGKKKWLPIRVVQAIGVVRRFPRASIYTTGAGVGLAFVIAGKLCGRYIVCQDSLTRIEKPSKWYSVAQYLANVTIASKWANFKSDLTFGLEKIR